MSKRFTDTEIWDKEWFMSLPPKLKCFVQYVRDKCDAAGIWQPNWVLAKTYIGEKFTEDDLLGIDKGNQFHKLPNGQICCIGFVNFQYGELTPSCPPHRKVIALLKKHGIENERVLLGYQNPTISLQEKEEEEDKEEDKGGVGENKDFEVFWAAYPKKKSKGDAEKAWKAINPTVALTATILDAINKFKSSVQWTKDNGQFIPYPATWLRAKGWEDELEIVPDKSKLIITPEQRDKLMTE